MATAAHLDHLAAATTGSAAGDVLVSCYTISAYYLAESRQKCSEIYPNSNQVADGLIIIQGDSEWLKPAYKVRYMPKYGPTVGLF